MNKPVAVGITGGIGAGKTTVAKVFAALSIPIYNADLRAKQLTNEDPQIKRAITELFGGDAYIENKLNRDFISTVVFNDPKKLAELNAVVHPRVADDFASWLTAQQSVYVLKEAALLFETGSYKTLDKVILVQSSTDLKTRRIVQRDPYRSIEEIEKIMANQWSDKQKEALADFIVLNDDQHLVIPQVLEIHRFLVS